MDNGRRHRHAAAATPRDPPAALLRRVRRRGSASGAAVPRRSRDPRPYPGGPGRQLPSAARGWRGRWGVAPAALRSEATITVEPLRELTATQRRQLDDEVDLVGAVMQAKPTLTVGTVTVGPHA